MKIVHVIPTYAPAWRYGGPILATERLAVEQARAGHAVSVHTTDLDGPGRLKVETGRLVEREGVGVRYHRARFNRRLHVAPTMRGTLREELPDADILHLHSVFLWPTLVAARMAERLGVPWIVSPRGMLVPELFRRRGALRKHLWMRLFERRTIQRAAGLLLSSELERREIEALGLQPRGARVLWHGVEAPALARPARPAGGVLRLAFLGRIEEKKGISLLLEALAEIEEAELSITGPSEAGEAERLQRAVRRHGLGRRVHFEPGVYGEDRFGVLAAADAVVLPSRQENFGNVVLEALGVGTPVVVSEAVGAAEVVRAFGGGLVVPRTKDALSGAVRDLARDRERWTAAAARARDSVRSQLSWAQVAARSVEAYRELSAS